MKELGNFTSVWIMDLASSEIGIAYCLFQGYQNDCFTKLSS